MLNYIQNLPEAKLWAKFPQWFQAIRTDDAQAMVAMLRSFSAEDGAQVLFFLRALNSLGRQAYMGNSKVYEIPYPDDMLDICRFFYYTESDIRKQWQDLQYRLPIGSIVLELVQAHKPDWFENVYYHHLQGMNTSYPTGIALERIGAPVFPPSSTAWALGYFLHYIQWHGQDVQAVYSDYPEILSRDIWTLFSEKTLSLGIEPYPIAEYCRQRDQLREELSSETLSYSEAVQKAEEILGPPEYEAHSPLAMALLGGIAANKLARERVLRETLLGICRNLERDQPNGFASFFTVLQPTQQELLDLQDELIAVLGCTHTKPITIILKYIKTVISHESFNYKAFIQALPVLLCSRVKSLYTVALSVAEELAKRSPAKGAQLCYAIPSTFSAPDEAIQIRAAKFLNTYGDAADTNLRAEIATWRPNLAVGALALLATFIDATEADVEQATATAVLPSGNISHLDESLRVTVPHNLEECLFLLTEAFGNPVDYHCSLVPDALLAVREQLDDESLHLLGPAITAARKVVCSRDSSLKVHMRTTALHFLRYCIERLEAAQVKNVTALKKKLPALITEAASQYILNYWDAYDKAYSSLVAPSLQNVFHTLDTVIEVAFARLRTGDTLPMLSSVTHAPCWIDPLELISRLLLWQQAGREPHSMDLQLALQRCAREKTHEALAAAQALKGEYKELFTYFLGDKPSLPSRRAHPAWWVTAALMRPERRVPQELLTPDFADIPPEYFGAPFQWNVVPMTREPGKVLPKYGYRSIEPAQEFAATSSQWLIVALPQQKHAPSYFSGYTREPDAMHTSDKWTELFCGPMFLGQDVPWLNQALALYPNNPEPLAMDFIAAYDGEPYDYVLRFLEKLLELRVPMGTASHLLLALSFVAGVKEPRLYAAAFWRTKVEEGQIDCAELGRLLGRLERHKWVPAKRFTDVVDKELLAVSPLHSAQLAIMLEAMLLELGPEPPVTIKRILEIYYELTAAQGKKVPAAMLPLLDAWATAKPQAAVCKKLQKL